MLVRMGRLLRDNGQSDRAFGVLEQSDGLLVSLAFEQHVVDGVDLVARSELRLGGRSALEHRLDEDGQVTLRVSDSADDAEAEAVGAAFQHDLRVRRRRRRHRLQESSGHRRRHASAVHGGDISVDTGYIHRVKRDGQCRHGRNRWRRGGRRRHERRIVDQGRPSGVVQQRGKTVFADRWRWWQEMGRGGTSEQKNNIS